jgi:hypothetical protein
MVEGVPLPWCAGLGLSSYSYRPFEGGRKGTSQPLQGVRVG